MSLERDKITLQVKNRRWSIREAINLLLAEVEMAAAGRMTQSWKELRLAAELGRLPQA